MHRDGDVHLMGSAVAFFIEGQRPTGIEGLRSGVADHERLRQEISCFIGPVFQGALYVVFGLAWKKTI